MLSPDGKGKPDSGTGKDRKYVGIFPRRHLREGPSFETVPVCLS
jgi:hypothetical protein